MSTATREKNIVHRGNGKLHPLWPVAVAAFRREGKLDATKLAIELAGCTIFSGKGAASGNRAYRIVAKDVLGYMHCEGHLIVDRDGWYELNEASLGAS